MAALDGPGVRTPRPTLDLDQLDRRIAGSIAAGEEDDEETETKARRDLKKSREFA
jgi:hypothetical protein